MAEKATILNPGEGLDETLAMKLVLEYFGGYVRERETHITTLTVATQIVENNPDRIGLQIVNNSDAIVYVGFTPDTSAVQGIPLTAAGGTLIKKFRDDGQTCGNAVYGLSGVAGEELTIIETILWGR